MGTHPIFESDFDCLTDMRFTRALLSRAARTEYRTPVLKEKYTPGKTFGFMPSGLPAYLLTGGFFAYAITDMAWYNYLIMEGAVARSSIAKRIELNREPDLAIIDLWGTKWNTSKMQKKPRFLSRVHFALTHPLYVWDMM